MGVERDCIIRRRGKSVVKGMNQAPLDVESPSNNPVKSLDTYSHTKKVFTYLESTVTYGGQSRNQYSTQRKRNLCREHRARKELWKQLMLKGPWHVTSISKRNLVSPPPTSTQLRLRNKLSQAFSYQDIIISTPRAQSPTSLGLPVLDKYVVPVRS